MKYWYVPQCGWILRASWEESNKAQETTYFMSPFIRNVQNRRLEGKIEGKCKVTANRCGGIVSGVMNMFSNCGDGCIPLWLRYKPLSCTLFFFFELYILNGWNIWYTNYISSYFLKIYILFKNKSTHTSARSLRLESMLYTEPVMKLQAT